MKTMKTKHTPGPWNCPRIFYKDGYFTGQAHKDNGNCPFEVFGETREEAEANARLIAAAPDLLECLKWATVFAEISRDIEPYLKNPLFGAWVEKCNSAIAKAEGTP